MHAPPHPTAHECGGRRSLQVMPYGFVSNGAILPVTVPDVPDARVSVTLGKSLSNAVGDAVAFNAMVCAPRNDLPPPEVIVQSLSVQVNPPGVLRVDARVLRAWHDDLAALFRAG